ncbi:MFS transporter [Reinekea marina]|uniref:MFS transporter n=2 Tax=Reinekea marina TaxID=1310421 RepID=A0ABV7WV76_9GAMM
MSTRLTTSIRIAYGASDLGVNILVIASILITFTYLTTVLGVDAGIAGTLLLAAKVWDVISDPIIGRLSDQTQSKYGRRLPWMAIGSVLMGLGFAGMFLAPFSNSPATVQGVYFVIALMITYTAFTMVGVPYGAMTPELTNDYDERSSLTAWRMTFGSVGLLIGGAGAPLLVSIFGGGLEGHRIMGLVFIPLITLPTLITVFFLRNVPLKQATPEKLSFKEQWALVKQNKPFVKLALTYLVQAGMMAQVTAGLLLACAYIFEAQDANALLTQLYPVFVLSTVLSLPFWLKVAKKTSKPFAFVWGGIVFTLGAGSMYFMSAATVNLGFIVMMIIGFGYSAYMIFPWSMMADAITHAKTYTDKSLEGLFNGWWTALQKVGIALGPFIIGWMLQLSGYQSSTDGSFPPQSEEALYALRLSISIIPAVVFALTLIIIYRWPLKREDLTNA